MNAPPRHDKFRAYRARKKAAGLREIRRWGPNIDDPAFRAKLARDMETTSRQEDEQDVMIFLDQATEELWRGL